jgi:hypothetical protein
MLMPFLKPVIVGSCKTVFKCDYSLLTDLREECHFNMVLGITLQCCIFNFGQLQEEVIQTISFSSGCDSTFFVTV